MSTELSNHLSNSSKAAREGNSNSKELAILSDLDLYKLRVCSESEEFSLDVLLSLLIESFV